MNNAVEPTFAKARSYFLVRALVPAFGVWATHRMWVQPGGPPGLGALPMFVLLFIGICAYWIDQACWTITSRGLQHAVRRRVIRWEEISFAQSNGAWLKLETRRFKVHLELSQFTDPKGVVEYVENILASRKGRSG